MTDTANLALPLIEAGQAQKHVTHNEALRILDAAIQIAVRDRNRSTPPAAPADGDRHLVAAAASGAWSGKDNAIATFQNNAWAFLQPRAGWCVWSIADEAMIVFDGTRWRDIRSLVLDNVVRLGVNTSADSWNKLCAKSDSVLFAAIDPGSGGSGDVRLQLSKQNTGNTASVLFANNYSGRAEFGLAGDDDFRFKVSPDGATWIEALVIERSTGRLRFPVNGGPREVLSADRSYFVRPDGNDGNSGLVNNASGAFRTVQRAIDVVWSSLDLARFNVTIQLAAGSYSAGVQVSGFLPGRGTVTIRGDTAAPGNVTIAVAGAHAIAVSHGAVLALAGLKLSTNGSGAGVAALTGGVVMLSGAMEFGAVAGPAHLHADSGGKIIAAVNYTISGAAAAHAAASNTGMVQVTGGTLTLAGTPAFTNFAAASLLGLVQISGVSFAGSGATGVRYRASGNGVVNCNGGGANYLPGNAAGTTATGGQYL